MKTVVITGNICIFDVDADTSGLSVCTKPDGYKTVVYSAGPLNSKYYCRVLLGVTKGQEVDHINGNTLDNRLCNLRIATSQQNKFNQSVRKTKVSGLPKGVTKHGPSYRAAIWINYTRYYLGTFITVAEAEAAYLTAAEKYQKEFASHISRQV